jgi:hypothetical protein
MSWARVDDQLYGHLKAMRLLRHPDGLAAAGLWTFCLSWTHAHGKQGIIPAEVAETFAGDRTAALADLLVQVRLWEPAEDDGWQFRNYRKWQQLDAREAMSKAGKRGADKRWGPTLFDADSNGVNMGSTWGTPSDPNSTQPNPTQPMNMVNAESSSVSDRFDDFWAVYPRRVAKQRAIRAWAKAVKGKDAAEVTVIISAAAVYAEHQLQPGRSKFTKHPATWLNDGGWDDEYDGDDDQAGVPPWDRPGYATPESGFGSDD